MQARVPLYLLVILLHLVSMELTADPEPLLVRVPVHEVLKLRCDELSQHRNNRHQVLDMNWEYKPCGSSAVEQNHCAENATVQRPWSRATCKNRSCNRMSMTVVNTSQEHSGLYRCLYKNYLSKKYTTYKVFQVVVLDPAANTIKILDPTPQTVSCQENSVAVLRCRTKSLLPPHLCWAKLYLPHNDSTVSLLTYQNRTYELLGCKPMHNGPYGVFTVKHRVDGCKAHHTGDYYCFAFNVNHMTLVLHTKLLVVVPAVRHFELADQPNTIYQTKSCKENLLIRLECEAPGPMWSHLCWTQRTYNGIISHMNYTFEPLHCSNIGNKVTYDIASFQPHHAGIYYCLALTHGYNGVITQQTELTLSFQPRASPSQILMFLVILFRYILN